MRKWIFPLAILVTMVVASRCHAWYAGYAYNSGTLTSIWGQVTPNLCPICTQGEAWLYQYNGKYVQAWVDAYSNLYTSTSVSPNGALIAATHPGSIVGVTFSASTGTAGKVTTRLVYTTSTGIAKNVLKTFIIPGWGINGGMPTIYSYGPELTAPVSVIDQWQSTMPVNASAIVSGGSVCGQPTWFSAKLSCP